MRIALLVGAPRAATSVIDSVRGHLALSTDARVVVLPCEGVQAESLSFHLHIGVPERGLVTLVPLAGEVLDDETWHALASDERVAVVDGERTTAGRLAEGVRLFDTGDLEGARAMLERVAKVIAGEGSPRQAELLVRLGMIARRQGRDAEAIAHFDHALAVVPTHPAALRERIELARASFDVGLAAALRRRSLPHAASDEDRVRALAHVADDSLAAAIEAMRAALELRPGHRALLRRLRAMHEANGDHAQAVDVTVAIAEHTKDPLERARVFVTAADLCAGPAKNVGRAVALYEAAIADDPTVPGAFEAIEKVLLDSEDYAGAERAYARQLERLKGRIEAESILLEKLARVRSEHLDDFEGAVQALDRLVALHPRDMEARAKLASLLEKNGEDALAVRCLEVAAVHAPARVETFHALHRMLARLGDADRSYAACSVLVHLGEADVDEQHVYNSLAPRVALAPSQALDDAAWALLYPEELDRDVSTIVTTIAPAAVALRIDALKASGQLPRLDPKARQDVEQSTVSAVRTVAWAARLLGVKTPAVYARAEELPSGIALVPAVEPTVALGKSLLSGRSVPELTFRITWELAYERTTGRLLHLYPSLAELSRLIVAAIATVLPDAAAGDAELRKLAQSLATRLDPLQRMRLEGAVKQLTARGGKFDLLTWIRSIERTACRTGLLASGDVNVAARLLAVDGRVASGLSAADRIRDLLSFSVSESYAKLRRALGVATKGPVPVRPSVRDAIAAPAELEVAVDLGGFDD